MLERRGRVTLLKHKQRILVFCHDQWHPAADVQRGLAALFGSEAEFQYVLDGRNWAPEQLQHFSRVVVAKANYVDATDRSPWLTPDTQGAFREFVRRGGGLLLVHGGTCYKDLPEMRGVTGGAFLRHPDPCPVTIQPTRENPLTTGVFPFLIQDEHYVMALDAADAEVFLEARSEHGVQPAGWTRHEGDGRVCVLTPGHNLEVWLHPEFQKLLRNGLHWLTTGN